MGNPFIYRAGFRKRAQGGKPGGGGGGVQLPNARYWRLYVTANQSGNATSLKELELKLSKFGANIATGGTASADAEAVGGYTAAQAFDGIMNDWIAHEIWATDGSVTPHWLKYDFGSPKKIVAAGLHARINSQVGSAPQDFKLQYSHNDSTWADAWARTAQSFAGHEFKLTTNPAYTPPTYTGSPHGTHTYWRVYVNQNTAGPVTPVSIAELEMRATPGGADQCSGGTAASDTEFDPTFSADKAFDNNAATFWHTASNTSDGWLRYAFASPVAVAEISVQARPSGTAHGPINTCVQWADSSSGPWTTAWQRLAEAAWSVGEVRVFTDPNYI